MEIQKIHSIDELTKELQALPSAWLLLVKPGSEQSECALENYRNAVRGTTGPAFFYADATAAADIHPHFGIRSVPSLLEFHKGTLANLIKGCHTSDQFTAFFKNAIFVAKTPEEDKTAKRVTVYSTPSCSWCTTLKRHLDHHQVRYRDVDISRDPKAAESMVRRSGQQGVPQIEINGQMVVGFDKDRINRLLEIH